MFLDIFGNLFQSSSYNNESLFLFEKFLHKRIVDVALSNDYFVILTVERDVKLPNIFPITKFKQLEYSHIKQKMSEIKSHLTISAKKDLEEKIQINHLIKPELSSYDFRNLISLSKKSENLLQSKVCKRKRKNTELLDASKIMINSIDQDINTERVKIVHQKMEERSKDFYINHLKKLFRVEDAKK